jgi:hypothetical protein
LWQKSLRKPNNTSAAFLRGQPHKLPGEPQKLRAFGRANATFLVQDDPENGR